LVTQKHSPSNEIRLACGEFFFRGSVFEGDPSLGREGVGRHNREGAGIDQRGFRYELSYQPDWLRHVKITRLLPSGRQSTMTLFRNPAERGEREPGDRVRTRVTCPEQGVDFEVVVNTNYEGVARVTVTCDVPEPEGNGREPLTFILENGLPPN
jgi:hypothetical protein